jgi:hypothetical protein
MAFGGLWAMGIPPLFWQTERVIGIFSTGTETGGFKEFSAVTWDLKNEKGARFGQETLRWGK